MNTRIIPAFCLLLTLLSSVTSACVAAATDIYLFRHAEKLTDSGRDPSLTQAGEARAKWLAHWLKDKKIKRIYSTDYKRTQQTVTPLAKQIGLPITSYNPRKLADFAKMLQHSEGTFVVVGHSNTTVEMVQLLGGAPDNAAGDAPFEAISESEYDRVYHVIINGQKVQTHRSHSVLSN